MVTLQEITDMPDKDVSQVIIDKVHDMDMAHERRDSSTSQDNNISSTHSNVSTSENNSVSTQQYISILYQQRHMIM